MSRIHLHSQVTEDEFCDQIPVRYVSPGLFYVFLFQCSQGCDYCRDPDAVDELVEHWRRGAMAGAYRSVSAGRTYIACDTSSGDDTELYEGGKFAYRRE